MHIAGQELLINGLPAQTGDEVAVFDSGEQLVGLFVVHTPGQYGAITVMGDSSLTPEEDEGGLPGEQLYIRVWDSSDLVELDESAIELVLPSECIGPFCPPDSLSLTYSSDSFYLVNIHPSCNIVCNTDGDCGTNGWISEPYCNVDNVWQDYRTYTCHNGGTCSSSCSFSYTPTLKDSCPKTCLASPCEEGICIANAGCKECAKFDLDNDRDIDIVDIQHIAARWNTTCQDPNYDPIYDFDNDCDIDIVDVMMVSSHWRWEC
jgi:hypothetical protein